MDAGADPGQASSRDRDRSGHHARDNDRRKCRHRRGRRRDAQRSGRSGGGRGPGPRHPGPQPRGVMTASVPFVDLRAMHEEVREEIETAWRHIVDHSSFVGGPAVSGFETAFAAYCESPYAVGVGSGTDALRIALQAVGVRPGDMVITVPHTFIATIEAIAQAGAVPALVDIDPTSLSMDPAAVRD